MIRMWGQMGDGVLGALALATLGLLCGGFGAQNKVLL